jgi:hypothetical protein
MVQGPRGRAFVIGAPLITEPMRLLALEWARKNTTAPTQETPLQILEDLCKRDILHSELQDSFTKTDEVQWKRPWRPADFGRLGDFLESLASLPLATFQRRHMETAAPPGDVLVRVLPVCSSWTNAPLVNIDRSTLLTGEFSVAAADWTPADQWPLLSQGHRDALPLSARPRLTLFLRHALLEYLRNHPDQFDHHARFDAHLPWGEPVVVYGGLTPQEEQSYRKINTARRWVCSQVFDGNVWSAAAALASGVADQSITAQLPLDAVDPLSETLSGSSVIAVVTNRRGDSGFMSPRGVLTQSISNAALYPDLVSAQRSIKGYGSGRHGVLSDTAVYFQAEVRLVGVAPDSSIKEGRPNELASGILSRLDREALRNIVGDSPDNGASITTENGSSPQGARRRTRRL